MPIILKLFQPGFDQPFYEVETAKESGTVTQFDQVVDLGDGELITGFTFVPHRPFKKEPTIGDIVANARHDIRYFRSRYGDYVSVWGKAYNVNGCDRYDGRMSAATGEARAVANFSIRDNYLKEECKEVSVKEVPAEWLTALQPRDK